MKNIFEKTYFYNKIVDKSQLKYLITWAFRNYGIARAANMADKLKDLGFHYATKAGISLSIEDLRIPPTKQNLLNSTHQTIKDVDIKYRRGEITIVERFQKVIDTWNYASETLKKQVVHYFKNTDPLNSIYMMAFSGARANISQVRQLVGMRGLMADPQGQIIDLPISSNFREGLTVTDYFISSYGARKGLVDTALRTADSGYLTRRLVDVAQDVIVQEYDCKTSKGILIEPMIDRQKTLIDFDQALLGRVLAEDVRHPVSNDLLAKFGQSIDPNLAQVIIKSGLRKILVRSPLTCDSIKSVCQLCYGWNLAHGKMVDLGEAIGIIAAQSIGEPGTQLTMRTFHTGGVFTGELTQNLISPINGRIYYDSNMLSSHTRTKHGDWAMLVNADSRVTIFNKDQKIDFDIPKESLILLSDKSKIEKGQILAEYPISNRSITERAQKALIADFSGSVYLTDSQAYHRFNSSSNSINSSDGKIAWILAGQVYDLPNDARLEVDNHQILLENHLLARTEIVANYTGRLHFVPSKNKSFSKILLITASKLFTNVKLIPSYSNNYRYNVIQVANKDNFFLKINPYKKISNNQIIADLISSVYKTKTGGIIKYLDISLQKNHDICDQEDQQDSYHIRGSGYILWIPEETHEINKDASLLLVSHGQFVEAGTEIIKNIFVNNSGVLEIIQRDGIIREIVVKPGYLYPMNEMNLSQDYTKSRGFLRPGETMMSKFTTEKLIYWESFQVNNEFFLLIRPVIIYSVPPKIISLDFSNDSFGLDMIDIVLVRKTYFRDGERIKSVFGVNLITTHLVLKLKNDALYLNCSMYFEPSSSGASSYLVKFIVADLITIKELNLPNVKDIYSKTIFLIQDNQIVQKNSTIAQIDIFSAIEGQIAYIDNVSSINRRILVITPSNTRIISIDNSQSIFVKINDWIYEGDLIATNVTSYYSGQVISVRDNQITLRIGQPYLISPGSFLHVGHQALVQRGENIATLIFERIKTGDIVQGLPRIEEILEARKKSDNSFNPHDILDNRFRFYLNQGLNIYDSTRLSFLDIQLLLVKEVQLVYQSQGVDISDKHIEVIVRQMTSKIKIEAGGETDYLPGEIVELQKVQSVNQSLVLINKIQATYRPILLGITKASLNTDSFISAASFQETTKVLTDAAISGKLDWLKGLKENVIIGRLIPAGTGFNVHTGSKLFDNNINYENSNFNVSSQDIISDIDHDIPFEDIIVDDRMIHDYNLNSDNN
uniref:DNA-directed RNA polymerase subunit beta'' n=1 Tax=Spyridia filamentosa TaxID=196632 RepID=A0A1Z1MJT7_SPYFI|nr:RNA polymerase b''''-subunit [Spyridia filamentosa]ARW66206.1 RNA polymerase b''''-subunit [Spyridia filamentosa]